MKRATRRTHKLSGVQMKTLREIVERAEWTLTLATAPTLRSLQRRGFIEIQNEDGRVQVRATEKGRERIRRIDRATTWLDRALAQETE